MKAPPRKIVPSSERSAIYPGAGIRTPKGFMRLNDRFMRHFRHGLAFWTSQDGSFRAIGIILRPDALAVLAHHYWPRIVRTAEMMDEPLSLKPIPERLKPAWVAWDWLPPEHFDDPTTGAARKGKGWLISETETLFPIYLYEL